MIVISLLIAILIASLFLLHYMITSFFKEFKKNCHEQIKMKDEEISEDEKFKEWLFK